MDDINNWLAAKVIATPNKRRLHFCDATLLPGEQLAEILTQPPDCDDSRHQPLANSAIPERIQLQLLRRQEFRGTNSVAQPH